MRGSHRALIKVIQSLPDDMGISVCVQNSGVYAQLTKESAIHLLLNSTPRWELSMRDDGDHYDAFISCDPGEGCETDDDLEKLQIAVKALLDAVFKTDLLEGAGDRSKEENDALESLSAILKSQRSQDE